MTSIVKNACLELLPIIQAGALGYEIEQRFFNEINWHSKTDGSFIDSFEYRVKSRTRMINGFTVPAPITITPALKDKYYIIATSFSNGVLESTWDDTELDYLRLNRNMCFLNRESAEQNAKAICNFDPAEPWPETN